MIMNKERLRQEDRVLKPLELGMVLVLTVVVAWGCSGGAAEDAALTLSQKRLKRLSESFGMIGAPLAASPVALELPDIGGRLIRTSDLRGRVVLIHFWTTWCPSCSEEMSSLERLHRRYKDRDFVLLAVDLKESVETVKAYLKTVDLTYPILMDFKGKYQQRFGIRSIPSTAVIGKNGDVVGMVPGPRQWDQKEAVELVEFLLKSGINNEALTRPGDSFPGMASMGRGRHAVGIIAIPDLRWVSGIGG